MGTRLRQQKYPKIGDFIQLKGIRLLIDNDTKADLAEEWVRGEHTAAEMILVFSVLDSVALDQTDLAC